MMRVIVSPAVLPPAALDALKQWLGITIATDDAQLSDLLATALEVCADFTGLLPLSCGVEETLPLPCEPLMRGEDLAVPQPLRLSSQPVQQVTGVAALLPDGTRQPLDASAYEVRLEADGSCHIGFTANLGQTRAVVSLTAGLAPDWDHLPQPLRHGVLRLAAHQYRQRETAGADALPPASVTALWRPWRRLRLA
ncbi:MAG: hypothetical protein KGJ57_06230 [Sphingomonadales bacterium]|nr:hypothetical protein [Sphingomonadales bacterium]MDE2169017.1 hypothetical protein [Sphingomonadales bacterium]